MSVDHKVNDKCKIQYNLMNLTIDGHQFPSNLTVDHTVHLIPSYNIILSYMNSVHISHLLWFMVYLTPFKYCY